LAKRKIRTENMKIIVKSMVEFGKRKGVWREATGEGQKLSTKS